jgi:hypothetical protein
MASGRRCGVADDDLPAGEIVVVVPVGVVERVREAVPGDHAHRLAFVGVDG